MEPFRIVNTHFEKDTLYSIGTVSSRDKHYSGNEFHSYKEIFEQIFKKKKFSIYWNKVYEPQFLLFDKKIANSLKLKNINFKIAFISSSNLIKRGLDSSVASTAYLSRFISQNP